MVLGTWIVGMPKWFMKLAVLSVSSPPMVTRAVTPRDWSAATDAFEPGRLGAVLEVGGP